MMACGEINFTEYFLPNDLPEFCRGCFLCLSESEQLCPHSQYTLPILENLIDADALVFTTPVYVLQTTGAVKAFFDHYSWMFIVHRAHPEMFSKKAFVLSTTAGAGTKTAMKTITTNLKLWGINKIYSSGFAMRAIDWKTVKPRRRKNFEKKLKKSAQRFFREIASGKKRPAYSLTWLMFYIRRGMLKKDVALQSDESSVADIRHWQEQGWFNKNPF
jgi:multimeric flavodoxin WrbA